jgi:PAS domain S-box-containing protein
MSADWTEMHYLRGKDFIAATEGPSSTWLQRYIHPEDQPQVIAAVNRAVAAKRVFELEHRVLRKDGTLGWTFSRAVPMLNAVGEIVEWFGTARDITDRKQAEEKLRESEERFRVTFCQAGVGIAQTGIDGQWMLLNDRFCEILGYSRDELRVKTFIDITHPDDRDMSLTAVRRLVADEISSWSSEKRYIRKDGVTIWGKVFVSLVRSQHCTRYISLP